MIEFNRANFIKFILEFDPIDYKFGKWSDKERKYVWPRDTHDNKKANITNYNQINQPLHIEPRDAAAMIISTEMAYGSLDKAMQYQEIFQATLEKILIDYVSIPGLSALFNEHYPEFEWSMHVNMNFKDQRNSYYRDHFIHQIRNMYMMFSLLNDVYIYKNAVENLTNPSVCRLTEYVTHCMLQYREEYFRIHADHREIVESFEKYKNNEKFCSFEQGSDCYYIRYVLYAASTIAALFHDIGYPISYFYEIEERAVEFVPAFTALLNEGDVNFNHIKDVLGDSLLFQIVNPKQIEARFLKRDHGVLSALLLALNFYKNGRIHSLSIEKQVAMEVGILMIYNHTLDFLHCDEKSGSPVYKLQFARDPLSWLFRFCDDAQEWDREYFEISSSPNLLFCPQCHTPLLKRTTNAYDFKEASKMVAKYLGEGEESECDWPDLTKVAHYYCRCNDNLGITADEKKDESTKLKRFNWFERRQIITVNVCDSVKLQEHFQTIAGKTKSKKLGYLLVDFHYDPYKQLRLCTIHHKFSEYRAKDLRKVKRFLQLQSFLVDINGYKRIVVEHNLSPNPYLLKAMIWGEYFKIVKKIKIKDPNAKGNELFDTGRTCQKNIGKREKEIKKEIVEEIERIVGERYKNNNVDFRNNVIYNSVFYTYLYFHWYNYAKGQEAIASATDEAERVLTGKAIRPKLSQFDICKYLDDLTAKQIDNKYRIDVDGKVDKDAYEKYLIEDDQMYPLLQQYCDKSALINQLDIYTRDYYSDLFLYEWLSLRTKQERAK